MRPLKFLSVALIGLAMAVPASALTASQTIQKEIITTNADGTQTVAYESAETVIPGERVVYTVNFENNRDEVETNLVLTMPVPAEVKYVEGTASDESGVLTFSADGGAKFAARDALVVENEAGEAVNASADDITHIRWVVAGPVNPGETGAISFTGILK